MPTTPFRSGRAASPQPPAGWKPEQGYIDPFANEKPLFTITGANADQYKDKLSPGLLALLKKYPDFRMPVYPTHRTAALPETAYYLIRAEGPRIEIKDGHISGRVYSSVPFPVPVTGEEAIQNHILRHTAAATSGKQRLARGALQRRGLQGWPRRPRRHRRQFRPAAGWQPWVGL
jgi:hypothetical protein